VGKLGYAGVVTSIDPRFLMKTIIPLFGLFALTACIGGAPPVNPVEPGAAGNASIAETSCRTAAAEEGLTVKSLTAFRETTGPSGPSGLTAVLRVGGAATGEAKCDFTYATGQAAVTLY
jgi:hypothetical protein